MKKKKYILKFEENDGKLTDIGTSSSLRKAAWMAHDYLESQCGCIDFDFYEEPVYGWDDEGNEFKVFIKKIS